MEDPFAAVNPSLGWTYSDDGAPAVPLVYGVKYYITPVDAGDNNGIRLSTSVANLFASKYMELIPPAGQDEEVIGVLDYRLTRENLAIPMEGYKEDDVLQIYVDVGFSLANPSGVEVVEYIVTAQDITNRYVIPPTTPVVGGYLGMFVGKKYSFHMATMPVEAGMQWGVAQMGMKRVDTAMVRFYNTKSYKISTDGYNVEERKFDDYDSRRDDVKIIGSPELDHIIHIQNDEPEPIYVASVALRGVANDG